MLVRYQYNFHAMLLLVNVMIPSQLCSNLVYTLLVSQMVSDKISYFTMACRVFHA